MSKANPLTLWKDKKVLILGDVMIDRYLKGGIHRISPEAPVPVLDLERQEDRLGGASNVALNVQSLGGIPILFSIVGEDETGQSHPGILSEQAQAHISLEGCLHQWVRGKRFDDAPERMIQTKVIPEQAPSHCRLGCGADAQGGRSTTCETKKMHPEASFPLHTIRATPVKHLSATQGESQVKIASAQIKAIHAAHEADSTTSKR